MIVELALRGSSPNSESPSPYKGTLEYTFKTIEFFKGRFIDFDGNLYNMLEAQPDYNADDQCPTFEPYTGDEYQEMTKPRRYSPELGIESSYARRLEDIDDTWVFAYITMALYAINDNKENGIKAYNRSHTLLNVMEDEEDGSVVSESELLTSHSNDYSPEEIAKAKEKIPYLLRRLHDKSKSMRVHIISLLRAHELAKNEVALAKRRDPRKTLKVAPRHLLKYNVHKMNPDGTIGPIFKEDANNREPSFKEARAWVLQYEDCTDAYTQDAIDLLHYYDVMGIDITKEDVRVYQEEYISQLTVLYISSNREYVTRKRSGFHKEVFEALRRVPLENFEAIITDTDEDEFDELDNTMHLFNDSIFINRDYDDAMDDSSDAFTNSNTYNLNMLTVYYNILYKTNIDPSKFITQDGFYYSDMETPFVLDISGLLDDNTFDENTPSGMVLVHESGFIVRLSKTHFSKMIRTEVVVSYLEQYYKGGCVGALIIPAREWSVISV